MQRAPHCSYCSAAQCRVCYHHAPSVRHRTPCCRCRCTAEDECATDTAACAAYPHLVCVDRPGWTQGYGFACRCPAGYRPSSWYSDCNYFEVSYFGKECPAASCESEYIQDTHNTSLHALVRAAGSGARACLLRSVYWRRVGGV